MSIVINDGLNNNNNNNNIYIILIDVIICLFKLRDYVNSMIIYIMMPGLCYTHCLFVVAPVNELWHCCCVMFVSYLLSCNH